MPTFNTLEDAEAGIANTILSVPPSLCGSSISDLPTRVNSTTSLLGHNGMVVFAPSHEKASNIALLPIVIVRPVALPPSKPKRKPASRRIIFKLWYNTYRYAYMNSQSEFSNISCRRKFFTFVVTLNAVGLLLAASNVWKYPRNDTSALILGNLLAAILVRNELFGRFLYLVVNTCFAKVCRVVLTIRRSRAHLLIS